MPHQNVEADKATAQNAATEPSQPNDAARDQNAAASPEPRSYAAPELADATLAPPAAGEIADYMDEGEDFDGDAVQSGGTRTNVSAHSRDGDHQGPKTTQANRDEREG